MISDERVTSDDVPLAPLEPGRSATFAALRAREAAEKEASAARQTVARRSALRAGVLVVVVLVVGVLVWWAARLPGSPVRDWVERRPADVTAMSFVDPEELPSTFVPGDDVEVKVQVQRTTAPGAPDTSKQLRWQARWEAPDGTTKPLKDGTVTVAPDGRQVLDLSVEPPGKASGRLVVAFDSGQWLALRLEAIDG
ncbi:hypothetical protein SAMN06264364_10297 [Quadrisphaera granulorum]|uniref:Uncharacterized protein n=1 Tax=Quadrisphaera granulorum TaxID=317664 RepID=A0A316AFQ1_9ACTN|nr:hypothetical protein [Quadrisphaera granulorum]PWJ55734.1 hypothetical protein BXY45_10297 [Quadrisphaera granulorum]SZE95231.1 hypothetical protein SAMN06264364_10297 [Quadrisphaera granulorum]